MIYSKAKTTLLIILIILSALFWAVKPVQAMRRESLEPDLIIQPGDLYTALDMSLQVGDGRRVDFAPFGLSWEA
jgi:hypothetical protein